MALKRGYVYIIGNHEFGWYKIGFTRLDPKARLAALQSGCPCKLKLVAHMEVKDARAVEFILHQRFSTRRLHGEWFKLTPEEIKGIEIDEDAAIAFYRAHVAQELGSALLTKGIKSSVPDEDITWKGRVSYAGEEKTFAMSQP